MTGIDATLAAAMRGDLRQWRGVSDRETRDSVAQSLTPIARIDPEQERIRKAKRFNVVTYEREIAPTTVDGWFLLGDPHLFLLEYGSPGIIRVEELLVEYGEPELVVPSHREAPAGPVSEHVYAQRGITLAMTESATNGRTERAVVHVQLYRAMATQFYVADIGSLEGPRPYPRENHAR
jgi:hypothetical protein